MTDTLADSRTSSKTFVEGVPLVVQDVPRRPAAERAGVLADPGFEWFELLRPLEGTDQYLVYTRWRSDADYQAWQQSQNFDRAHDGGGDTLAPAAADSHHLWSYEVLESAGPHADQPDRA